MARKILGFQYPNSTQLEPEAPLKDEWLRKGFRYAHSPGRLRNRLNTRVFGTIGGAQTLIGSIYGPALGNSGTGSYYDTGNSWGLHGFGDIAIVVAGKFYASSTICAVDDGVGWNFATGADYIRFIYRGVAAYDAPAGSFIPGSNDIVGALVRDGVTNGSSFWVNGKKVHTFTASGYTAAAAATNLFVNSPSAGGGFSAGFYSHVYAASRSDITALGVTEQDMALLTSNVDHFLEPIDLSAYIASSGGTTGTIAVTLANTTFAGVGAPTVIGTIARTLADTTLAASGTPTIIGTIGVTLANATFAGVGDTGTGTSGTINVTLANTTLVSSGASTNVGSIAVTLANTTLAGAGTSTITGVIGNTLANATFQAAGYSGSPPTTTFGAVVYIGGNVGISTAGQLVVIHF